MAALKSDPSRRDTKLDTAGLDPLARVMREFEELALSYETGLLRSLEDAGEKEAQQEEIRRRDNVRHEARRLAITDLSCTYTRKQIRRSLEDAESLTKSAEEQLHHATNAGTEADLGLGDIHDGHFRLFSSELFDMLGQPTNLRFGTLRFHTGPSIRSGAQETELKCTSVELALNTSFFVADSTETLPYHCFNMPELPSLRNRGILSRKPEDDGAFPEYDSWLLFTFLGSGCLKVEIPIEMCADVYGGTLRGRENEEVIFWGIFVEDDTVE